MATFLKGENLVKKYRGRKVVNNVTIELSVGEIVGLLGPNGAGKTTTFYILTGLISPNSGKVFLNGKDVSRLPIYKRARLGLGYLPQEPSIFRKLTVEENIMLILECMKMTMKERNNILERLLDEFNLKEIRKEKAYVLSGGQRRRVEIARALCTEPSFLLLDEPFTGIDPITVQEIQKVILHLKKKNIGVLITDHSVKETLEITDRAYIMYDSGILISGTAEEILSNEAVKNGYLGEREIKIEKQTLQY